MAHVADERAALYHLGHKHLIGPQLGRHNPLTVVLLSGVKDKGLKHRRAGKNPRCKRNVNRVAPHHRRRQLHPQGIAAQRAARLHRLPAHAHRKQLSIRAAQRQGDQHLVEPGIAAVERLRLNGIAKLGPRIEGGFARPHRAAQAGKNDRIVGDNPQRAQHGRHV